MIISIVFLLNKYKNSEKNFAEPKVLSLRVLFFPTNTQKSKHIQFSLIYVKEKQQILPFGQLELENAYQYFTIFRLKND